MIYSESMMENELNSLKGEIAIYVSLVSNMLDKSIAGLYAKNTAILNEVIFNLEPRANEIELMIDDKCIALIAKYSPKASSLRTIQAIMKINLDLERMADHTVNISREALDIINNIPVIDYNEINLMAEKTKKMLNSSLQSFIDGNIHLANFVCESDSKIDEMKNEISRKIIYAMKNDTAIIEQSLHYFSIVRNIERIADLTTNIAENSIFVINGKTIKHSYK